MELIGTCVINAENLRLAMAVVGLIQSIAGMPYILKVKIAHECGRANTRVILDYPELW